MYIRQSQANTPPTSQHEMASSRSTDHDHELTRSDGEPVLCMDSVTGNVILHV